LNDTKNRRRFFKTGILISKIGLSNVLRC